MIQLAPVVGRLDITNHLINLYPVNNCKTNHDTCIWLIVTYPGDSVIHLLNNSGLSLNIYHCSLTFCILSGIASQCHLAYHKKENKKIAFNLKNQLVLWTSVHCTHLHFPAPHQFLFFMQQLRHFSGVYFIHKSPKKH